MRCLPRAVALSGVAVLGVLLTTACTQSRDPLQVADVLEAARPAVSPPAAAPDGTVRDLGGPALAAIVEPASRVAAVVVTDPDRVLLHDLGDASGLAEPRTVDLPGRVEQLALGVDGELLAAVPSANVLLRIAVGPGTPVVTEVPVDGGPVSAAVVAGRTVVAATTRVLVLDGDRVVHTVDGFTGASTVVAAGGQAMVLDRLRTAVVTIDPLTGERGPGLRAGSGATNAVGDRYDRVLVTDTRDGELLAFSADPLLMRQRFPVPGSPYAIAYDSARDLAWVTLTGTNEVVAFDVAGGEPVERMRLATVRQPDTVAVDPGSGAVVVASGVGEGIQVVQP